MRFAGQRANLLDAALNTVADPPRSQLGELRVLEEPAHVYAALAGAPHQLQRVDPICRRFRDRAPHNTGNLFDRTIERASERQVEVRLKRSGPPFADGEGRARNSKPGLAPAFQRIRQRVGAVERSPCAPGPTLIRNAPT